MYRKPHTAERKARLQEHKARNERRRAEKAAGRRLPEYYSQKAEEGAKTKKTEVVEYEYEYEVAGSDSSDDSYNDDYSDSGSSYHTDSSLSK